MFFNNLNRDATLSKFVPRIVEFSDEKGDVYAREGKEIYLFDLSSKLRTIFELNTKPLRTHFFIRIIFLRISG